MIVGGGRSGVIKPTRGALATIHIIQSDDDHKHVVDTVRQCSGVSDQRGGV